MSRLCTTLPYLHLQWRLSRVKDLRKQQHQRLLEILKVTEGSSYRKHLGDHKIESIEDFQKIPLQTYDSIAPFIEKSMAGHHEAMFATGHTPLMFSMTSGTTGPSKYIPVTQESLKALRKTWWFLGVNLLYENPGDHLGDVMNLSSSSKIETTSAGIPCGDTSGQISDGQSLFVTLHYALPPNFQEIKHVQAKYYAYLKCGIKNKDMQMMMTATPATITSIGVFMNDWSKDLIDDIRHGTFKFKNEIPKEIYEEHQHLFEWKDEKRAKELEILKKDHEHLHPSLVWPRMKLISCWLAGSFQHYRDKIRNLYGPVRLRDIGLASSEGHFTLPVRNESSHCILNIWSFFFEFISESGEFLTADQLQEGEAYAVVVTTPGGLIRYQMHDLVVCRGFSGSIPELEFLSKESDFLDLTGEKLTSYQASLAMSAAQSRLNVSIERFIVIPNENMDGFLIRHNGPQQIDEAQFVEAFDQKLSEINECYLEHRQIGKLQLPQLSRVSPGLFAEIDQKLRPHRESRLDQFKPPLVSFKKL